MHPEALWAAATPLCTFVGAVVAFYLATESGDDMPRAEPERHGEDAFPWGMPSFPKGTRIPGDSVQRTNRVMVDSDTTHIERIKDERITIDG